MISPLTVPTRRRRYLPALLVVLYSIVSLPTEAAASQDSEGEPLKIFILAGQSNMQGHAAVKTLAGMAADAETEALYGTLVDADGAPRVLEDVWISSLGSSDEVRAGQLTAGFGAGGRGPKIGPEFSFGAVMHEHLGEPILIIKTAWGGKSIHTDFRPPSAGPFEFTGADLERLAAKGQDVETVKREKAAATGVYYRQMMDHVQAVLADIKAVYPDYDEERGHALGGFVWFQGWNDMVASDVYPERGKPGGYDAYSDVMAHFIRDVRSDLGAPELPFVIGVLGVGGPTAEYGPKQQRYTGVHQNFRDAMAAPASMAEFQGTVKAVLTESFWDPRASELRAKDKESLTADERVYLEQNVSNAEYHYLGSAKVLTRVGEAFANAVADLSPAEDSTPRWVWLEETESNQEVIFRRQFDVASVPGKAIFAASCDNHMIVLVNGERIGSHGRWEQVVGRDVASMLKTGENLLEIRARNEGGAAGMVASLSMDGVMAFATDDSWDAALAQRAARGRWSKATILGSLGDPSLPWSGAVTPERFAAPSLTLRTPPPAGPQAVQLAEEIHLLDGFEADLLYTVPNEVYGSWVTLTTDPEGRLYTSDQSGKGLFRITPAKIGDPSGVTSVEKVAVDVSGAQGMCWAFDSLYVNVNGQGVWRIKDTDGDDQLDSAEHLIKLGNGGEHGPHAIIKTEDGEGLYFIAGNHVKPPQFQGSRAPSNWGEDQLLERLWDPGGHARGMKAPGGWVARCDPEGENIQIISNGYRNQYDIALNADGEMFTYDSDMEWDIGTPWYRPTRVCHVTSGSEFGWRGGTGKWPAYYEDSTPPVLEIGPGSPTGVVFGAGAKFPAKYQEALFVLDWTFGTIYALHLEPEGATYRATKEDFAWAKPLGVTDATIGPDGAMYFTVGGRGSQSALYRVRYAGEEAAEPALAVASDDGTDARALRRLLESFHGRVDANAVDAAWPSLKSPDRAVRFAARLAVENQPVASWRERALAETNPQAAAMALLALSRQGEPQDLPRLVAALGALPLGDGREAQTLTALRAYALAFVRLGAPSDELSAEVLARLEPMYPVKSAASAAEGSVSDGAHRLNLELARLLTYVGSDQVVPKTMALIRQGVGVGLPPWAELIERNDTYGRPIAKMLADMPPMGEIDYALILMNATEGWTLPLRREYFTLIVEASKHAGGASYAAFLGDIRDFAAEGLTNAELRPFAELLGQSLVAPLPDNITPPVGPGQEWTLEAAMAAVETRRIGRSYDSGHNLYHSVSCSQCHRFSGEGGAIGPDLSTVANKFSVPDILEAIIDPSKIISDQYGSHIVLDNDGLMTEGILVDDGDEVAVYPRDNPQEPTFYDRSEIKLIKESKISQMPNGLVDPLSAEELADLVAFLVSGGNPEDPAFANDAEAGGRR